MPRAWYGVQGTSIDRQKAPDLSHAAVVDEDGDVVVPEVGAGGQRHELCTLRFATSYAEPAHGSSGCTELLENRKCARSEDLARR